MIDFNIDNYLRISLTDVILVCISTFLIIMIARKYFWSKLLEFVQKRQDLIQENIDASVQLKSEAQKVKDAYDLQMKEAGKQAHSILESARESASLEKKQILEKAESQAALIKAQAKEDILREKRNAQKDMREAISSVALEAAKKLVEKEMDQDLQKKFVDDFIEQAGDKQW